MIKQSLFIHFHVVQPCGDVRYQRSVYCAVLRSEITPVPKSLTSASATCSWHALPPPPPASTASIRHSVPPPPPPPVRTRTPATRPVGAGPGFCTDSHTHALYVQTCSPTPCKSPPMPSSSLAWLESHVDRLTETGQQPNRRDRTRTYNLQPYRQTFRQASSKLAFATYNRRDRRASRHGCGMGLRNMDTVNCSNHEVPRTCRSGYQMGTQLHR